MISQGLVVESRFSARKELVRDLNDGGIAHDIIEAQSIDDGLFQLESRPLDACFVGPTISESVAVRFIREGTYVSRRRDCAFIVVLSGGEPSAELLHAGAHGSIIKPYTPTTFSEMVSQAIARAKGALPWHDMAMTSQTQLPNASELVEGLYSSAAALREVSANIFRGRFCLQRGGKPSLATRDAIRLALEQAFPKHSEVNQIGSFDNALVAALVQWCSDRVSCSHSEATEQLRVTLLTLAPTKR